MLQQTTVLVMAKDRFVSALLGALIELSGRTVAFRADDETSYAAVRRTRPDLVICDCALGLATCTEVAAITRLEGVKMLMFSASHTDREARDIAGLYGAQSFVLPVKPRDFMASIDRVMETTIST